MGRTFICPAMAGPSKQLLKRISKKVVIGDQTFKSLVDAGKHLGVNPCTVRNWIKAGKNTRDGRKLGWVK